MNAVIARLAPRDGVEEDHQAPRCRCVVQALVERFLIFHPTKHLHAAGVKGRNRAADVRHAKSLDEEISGNVAAHGDHRLAELTERQRLAGRRVHVLVRVVSFAQRVGASVHDAVKLVADGQRIIE